MNYIFFYLLFINALGLYIMFIDKQRAKEKRYRIREKTLWMVAILGGAMGEAIAMKWFRHKTKHLSFKWGLPSLAVLELGLIVWFLS